jgi:hypothetical protein
VDIEINLSSIDIRLQEGQLKPDVFELDVSGSRARISISILAITASLQHFLHLERGVRSRVRDGNRDLYGRGHREGGSTGEGLPRHDRG